MLDLARTGALGDGFNRGFYIFLVDGDLKFDFFEQAARFLVAAINLGDALLATTAAYCGESPRGDMGFILLNSLFKASLFEGGFAERKKAARISAAALTAFPRPAHGIAGLTLRGCRP